MRPASKRGAAFSRAARPESVNWRAVCRRANIDLPLRADTTKNLFHHMGAGDRAAKFHKGEVSSRELRAGMHPPVGYTGRGSSMSSAGTHADHGPGTNGATRNCGLAIENQGQRTSSPLQA